MALIGVRFSRGSGARGGQAPARRLRRSFCFTVGRGPVPRHAWVHRSVRAFQRSRGTGPRATVLRQPPFHRRAWALGCHTRMRAGFPRHAWVDRSVRAFQRSRGTGPRATVAEELLFHRRARACPSPCPGRSQLREGQALALRYSGAWVRGGQARARWESTRAFQICPARGQFAARLNAEYLR